MKTIINSPKYLMRVITLHEIDETESSDFEYVSIYLDPTIIEKNKLFLYYNSIKFHNVR